MSIFSSIRTPRIKKTAFDLSFENKLSCNMGQLVPVFCKEVLPGDKWRAQTTTLIRFSPLRSPIMQSIDAYVHYFFVPNRLLMPQKDWETFITGGKTGEETAQLPYLTLEDIAGSDFGDVGSLADYLGYPVNQTYISGSGVQNIDLGGNQLRVSTLPLRAYQLIWQEYYRDQNLTEEIFDFQNALPYDDDNDYTRDSLLTLRNRCWKKDYFTSALPFVQRGQPASLSVTINNDGVTDGISRSIDTLSTVYTVPSEIWTPGTQRQWDYNGLRSYIYNHLDALGYTDIEFLSSDSEFGTSNSDKPVTTFVYRYRQPGVDTPTERSFVAQSQLRPEHVHDVDFVSSSSQITINDIRRAESLQQWLERNARGGARYIEQILSHFGVVSSDARLQRPEYLGGGRQPINVSEVLQTSQTQYEEGEVRGTPQGNMAGHAISAGQTISFKRKFEEHGFIIGIMSVMPHASYSQGCPKSLTRFDKLDYAFPEFAHLGEQPIKGRELYLNGTDQGNNDFGYQSVYADYKFSNDEVHGDFKTNLNYWHMGRIFANAPSLNASFVTANPTHRIFAVENPEVQKLWCELYHNVQAVRPLPKYGTPMMSI